MPTALTDADKVIRNDTGKEIAAAIRDLAAPEADKVAYDNTSSGLSADDVQDAIDELAFEKMEKSNPTGTGALSLNRKANTTVGNYSVAEGYNGTASGNTSHAEGTGTTASGDYSHAEGVNTTASGERSHAEGTTTTASGYYSHAEGNQAVASAQQSHAEGYQTEASGNASHTEGHGTTASNNASHSEGRDTTASGSFSHAEGYSTTASGDYGSHAEGSGTIASGICSHAEGSGTIANHAMQHSFGQYNVADPSSAQSTSKGNYIEIVGKGSDNEHRSNARTLDWSGNETLAGDLKINGNQSLSKLWTTLSGLTALSEKSGSIASFSTDIADKLFSCYINVTAVQAGSGTPAPDNVRSISGWSACNLVGCQKNILDYEAWKSSTPMVSRATYVFQNNGISVTATSGDGYCRPSYEIPVRSGQQITLSWSSESNIVGTVYVFFSDTNFVNVLNSAQKLTTVIPDDCSKIRIRFGVANTGDTINYKNLQIEYNSTSTTYQAYNGTTHNIPFNTTVYGGVLDVLSGVLTVTHEIFTPTNSMTVVGLARNTHNCWCFTIFESPTIFKNDGNVLSNINIPVTWQASLVSGFCNAVAQGKSLFALSDSDSGLDGTATQAQVETAFQNFVSTYSPQAVYELKTPTTIQLTPTEVKTILGQNNIFADTGDIDLKYLETIGNRLA